MSVRLIRLDEVEDKTALKSSSIYRRMQAGSFPKPISVGGRTVRWLESEIDGWIEQQVEKSRDTPATATRRAMAVEHRAARA